MLIGVSSQIKIHVCNQPGTDLNVLSINQINKLITYSLEHEIKKTINRLRLLNPESQKKNMHFLNCLKKTLVCHCIGYKNIPKFFFFLLLLYNLYF
jgi:hypothetical protein